VSKLPTVALPVALSVPVMFAPAVVKLALAVPLTNIATLPAAVGMLTFELPFANEPTKLPAVMFPVTASAPEMFDQIEVTTIVVVPAITIFRLPPTSLMLA